MKISFLFVIAFTFGYIFGQAVVEQYVTSSEFKTNKLECSQMFTIKNESGVFGCIDISVDDPLVVFTPCIGPAFYVSKNSIEPTEFTCKD